MSRPQIEVNGLLVDLRPKGELIKTVKGMVAEYSGDLKAGNVKTNHARTTELATISFFGSIKHYLEGGAEV